MTVYKKTYTGKNIDDVLENIITERNCLKENISYKVIEEKKGILGLKNSITIEAYTKEDVKEFIFDYLGNFLTESNFETSIEIREKDGEYKVILDTDSNPIIIGHNGKTLSAINIVLKSACNSYFDNRFSILVDVGKYKEDKYYRIIKTAIRTAKNVIRTKIDASLDPMTNDERKVIHQKLQEFKNIKTESEGEGINRHLVIKYVEESE